MTVTVFGIRHHGPGSARSLNSALERLQPDCLLIEGPPDADEIISLAAKTEMQPPVAILVYLPDNPQKAVVYPFAVFSPEWQALQYGLKNNLPVHFMDLPQYFQLKKDKEENELPERRHEDPITIMAKVSGYSDGEMWWDNLVENRRDDKDIFTAIAEMMTELRNELPLEDKNEPLREAYMRKSIRKAKKDGYANIAVVCGAWHVPALIHEVRAADDEKLLKELKMSKTAATWIPWTHSRLSFRSGYGAGIESPGWYHHLWTVKKDIAISWLAKVSALFRENDMEVSSAHLVEAARMAETLAIVRNKNQVGLNELNEAVQAVMCFGSNLPLKLVSEKLITGNVMGEIPPDTPITPIQQDFQAIIKKLRLKTELNLKEIDLDLRKENDLEKSYLLHRLNILGIYWGKIKTAAGKKGTFHELWDLEWKPEFPILMIEAGIWGNTVKDAANAYAVNRAIEADELPELTGLLEVVLLASLPEALEKIMKKLQDEAALTTDIVQLMEAVPPMANILRYGNVRKTDSEMVKTVLDGLVTRICIGLPNAAASVNYDASAEILKKVINFNDSLKLLQDKEYLLEWHKALSLVAESEITNGLLSGYACRLLFDAGYSDLDKTAVKMSFALSPAGSAGNASEWLEGFLKGSGLLLIHSEKLLNLIDNWLTSLSEENFVNILPVIRRNFSGFSSAEKRQIGEIIKNSDKPKTEFVFNEQDFDYERASSVLPVLKKLLGVN